jgi:hypothetical protein
MGKGVSSDKSTPLRNRCLNLLEAAKKIPSDMYCTRDFGPSPTAKHNSSERTSCEECITAE